MTARAEMRAWLAAWHGLIPRTLHDIDVGRLWAVTEQLSAIRELTLIAYELGHEDGFGSGARACEHTHDD